MACSGGGRRPTAWMLDDAVAAARRSPFVPRRVPEMARATSGLADGPRKWRVTLSARKRAVDGCAARSRSAASPSVTPPPAWRRPSSVLGPGWWRSGRNVNPWGRSRSMRSFEGPPNTVQPVMSRASDSTSPWVYPPSTPSVCSSRISRARFSLSPLPLRCPRRVSGPMDEALSSGDGGVSCAPGACRRTDRHMRPDGFAFVGPHEVACLTLRHGCREVVAPEPHEPLVKRRGGPRSVLESGAGLGLEGVLLEAPCLLPLLIRGLGLAVCPSQGRELPLDGHVVWQCVPCGRVRSPVQLGEQPPPGVGLHLGHVPRMPSEPESMDGDPCSGASVGHGILLERRMRDAGPAHAFELPDPPIRKRFGNRVTHPRDTVRVHGEKR